MTPDQLHDALTLLPADLVAQADRKRSRKPRPVFRRFLPLLAACLALVLCTGWYSARLLNTQNAAEAPMLQHSITVDSASPALRTEAEAEAAPMENAPKPTLCALPTVPAENAAAETAPAAGSPAQSDLCIDHTHHPAEASEESVSGAWCGNMTATVYLDGAVYELSGQDAVLLTDILYSLDYQEHNLCRCAPEFTADTEMGTGYAISLTNYFVRYENTQAPLTPHQADSLRQLLSRLTG